MQSKWEFSILSSKFSINLKLFYKNKKKKNQGGGNERQCAIENRWMNLAKFTLAATSNLHPFYLPPPCLPGLVTTTQSLKGRTLLWSKSASLKSWTTLVGESRSYSVAKSVIGTFCSFQREKGSQSMLPEKGTWN